MKGQLHIVIIRTSNTIIDFNTYNCQEIGLARALVKRGYKVSVITAGINAEHTMVNVEGYTSIDVYRVKCFSLNTNICYHIGFKQLLKRICPDILHVNSISHWMSYEYVKWAKDHGKKSIVIQGNYELNQKPVLKQLELLFNSTIGRYIIKQTDGVGGKTNWACDFVKRFYPTETMLTRIGLDESKFAEYEQCDWRSKLHLEGKHILLYVGKQEPRRNPLFLVEVIARLPENYILLMIGHGPLFTDVSRQIEIFGLQNRIYQLGILPQTSLPSLYQISDISLLATNYEIFGMVLLESMYFGVPVFATMSAGSDSIIQNGKDGVICSDLNSQKWAIKIKILVENEEALTAMKKEAHNKIINELIWDKTVNEFIALYDKVLRNVKT